MPLFQAVLELVQKAKGIRSNPTLPFSGPSPAARAWSSPGCPGEQGGNRKNWQEEVGDCLSDLVIPLCGSYQASYDTPRPRPRPTWEPWRGFGVWKRGSGRITVSSGHIQLHLRSRLLYEVWLSGKAFRSGWPTTALLHQIYSCCLLWLLNQNVSHRDKRFIPKSSSCSLIFHISPICTFCHYYFPKFLTLRLLLQKWCSSFT